MRASYCAQYTHPHIHYISHSLGFIGEKATLRAPKTCIATRKSTQTSEPRIYDPKYNTHLDDELYCEYNRSSTDDDTDPDSSDEDGIMIGSDETHHNDPDILERAKKIISENTEEFQTYLKSVIVCFGNHNKSDSQEDMKNKTEIFNARSFTSHCVPMMVPTLPFLK